MAGESSGAKGFAFFGINVDLTEDGIEHVDDIVTLAFQVRSRLTVHYRKNSRLNHLSHLLVLEYATKVGPSKMGIRRTRRSFASAIPFQG